MKPVLSADANPPSVLELTQTSLKIGVLSFGGPAGQIALMHREIVEDKGWLSEEEYLNALSFCMLLPGPEAMQLATYSGWRLHGVLGGLIAGLLFVLPGAAVVLALVSLYAHFGAVSWVGAVFVGVKAAVVVIVIEALLKVAKRALKSWHHWMIAALAFLAIFFFNAPFPILVALAAIYGFLNSRAVAEPSPGGKVSLAASLKTVMTWLAIWWAPIAALLLFAPRSILIPIGLFFAKLAVVTFGGAYAVLAYMAQEVVSDKKWLNAGQMIDGLGLAETTPGPLILVTEFVGFLAGFGAGGLGLGIAAALLTLWMTFAPCFLWIFTGAPYIERLSHQPRLRSALAGVTACVVGVILNLTFWFALHVLFADLRHVNTGPFEFTWPIFTSVNWVALALTLLATILLLAWKRRLGEVLLIAGAAGLLLARFL